MCQGQYARRNTIVRASKQEGTKSVRVVRKINQNGVVLLPAMMSYPRWESCSDQSFLEHVEKMRLGRMN